MEKSITLHTEHRANDAILKSALDFDNVDLFGPIQVTESTGIDWNRLESTWKLTKSMEKSWNLKGYIYMYILILSHLF